MREETNVITMNLANRMATPFKGTQKQAQAEKRDEINIAINGGLGRIGKSLFRMVEGPQCHYGIVNDSTFRLMDKAKDGPKVNIVAMNLSKEMDAESLVSALRFDTSLRAFPGKIEVEKAYGGEIFLNVTDHHGDHGHKIRVFDTKDINELKWNEVKADIVVDATGFYKTGKAMQPHIDNGALRGIITCPNKDADLTNRFVAGVNSEKLDISDTVFSAASCTTTCIAPVIKALHDEIGVKRGFIQSTHSATASQYTQDKAAPAGKDGAKMRSVFNIIPSTTGAAKAIGDIIPSLKGKLNGLSARVPVSNSSLAYIVLEMENKTSVEEVKKLLADKAASPEFQDLLVKAPKDAVSSDVQGMHQSAIYIEDQIQVIDEKMVVVPAFYDNEWGYTRSVLDLAKQAGQQLLDANKAYSQQEKGKALSITG